MFWNYIHYYFILFKDFMRPTYLPNAQEHHCNRSLPNLSNHLYVHIKWIKHHYWRIFKRKREICTCKLEREKWGIEKSPSFLLKNLVSILTVSSFLIWSMTKEKRKQSFLIKEFPFPFKHDRWSVMFTLTACCSDL